MSETKYPGNLPVQELVDALLERPEAVARLRQGLGWGPLTVPVRLLDKRAVLPERAHPGDAGVDLVCLDPLVLQPGERVLACTGLSVAIPEGFEAQIRPRSGLASRLGLGIPNSPGTIDSGYRGEIKVLLINLGREAIHLEARTRIAQLVVAPCVPFVWKQQDALPESRRGEGGFGSTGTGPAFGGEG